MVITTQKEANDRIVSFLENCGDGSLGLTEVHKKNRIGKFLGKEGEKVLGFGKDINSGVDIMNKMVMEVPEDNVGFFDNLHPDILKNINNYPSVQDNETHKIIFMEIKDDGEMNYNGIIIDGKENDPAFRSTFSVLVFDDVTAARCEIEQYKIGILKEVSDRTMAIHSKNNNLNDLLADDKIDTSPDTEGFY